MKKTALFFWGCLALPCLSQAEIKLPAILGDHMVLQQGKASLWGQAEAGKTLSLTLAGQKTTAKVDSNGKWKTSFPALKAGGPYELVISGDGTVTIKDVLVGDVWLASGQSNMEFALRASRDAGTEIPKADFPKIRQFTLDHTTSFSLLDDVRGSWSVCSPSSAGGFSAVAFHFGKELHKSLKAPVGLINSSWGGTPAEDWVPRPALDKEPDFAALLKRWDSDDVQNSTWKNGNDFELVLCDLKLIPKDPKAKARIISLQSGGDLGGAWTSNAKPGSSSSFTPDKGPKGAPAARFSGLMQGGAWGGAQTPLSGNAPVDLTLYEAVEFQAKGRGKYRLKLGQSSITDYDYYATDIFQAPQDWQVMRYSLSSLKQGGWGAPKPFSQDAIQMASFTVEVPYWPDVASIVYNAMIAPLTSFSIKGVIWYQGESNAGRPEQYHKLLSTLIKSWRKAWNRDFPFLIVQLPNYMAVRETPHDSEWAKLREAQFFTSQTVPHTGMVTTLDLGEANDIHPKNKKDVGERLALLALKSVYAKKKPFSQPQFKKAVVKGGEMVLTFTNVGAGLSAKGGGPLKGFALAGDNQSFSWADAKIVGTSTVVVSSPQVKKPEEVRYAWADNPVCNLASKEGFPASPFRHRTKPLPPPSANEEIPEPPQTEP